MLSIFTVGCLALALYLLPRLKGVIIAVQWARYMHGFGHEENARNSDTA